MHPHRETGWSLLLADTDATQAYVFESNKLPEIRGASGQLDALNREIGRMVAAEPDANLIFAGGGGLLAIVPTARAAALARDIERLYPAETTVATISVDHRPLPPNHADLPFGDLVTWGMRWLRRHKESRAAPPFVDCLPHQTRCQSCQKRPADAGVRLTLVDYPICTVCWQKRQAADGRFVVAPLRTAFDDWYEQFKRWLVGAGSQAVTDYYAGHPPASVIEPMTIDEIAGVKRGRDGHVGFVYLDGDGIGDLLQRLPSADAYRTFSQQLTSVTRHAVFAALATECRPSVTQGSDMRATVGQRSRAGANITIFPFQIITIGGDDVLLIVPAHAALPVAQQIGAAFGDTMTPFARELFGEDVTVTMSAGVVLADDHTPVRLLFDLSQQLLKSAKRRGGAIDFHVLKSADITDRRLDRLRDQEPYTLPGGGDRNRDARLLGRPYPHPTAAALLDGLRQLRIAGFPRTQLHLLAASLSRGRREATLFYEYQRARTRGDGFGYLETLLQTLYARPGGDNPVDPLPWRAITGDRDISHTTALWDIAELYDYTD